AGSRCGGRGHRAVRQGDRHVCLRKGTVSDRASGVHRFDRARGREGGARKHRALVWRDRVARRAPGALARFGRVWRGRVSGLAITAGAPARKVRSLLSEERTVAILADLVRARGQNPQDGEAAVADFVAQFLERRGLEVERQEVLPGRDNVLGRLRGTGGGPVLAFNTHMDTVPEGTGWTRSPFAGEVVDGRLFGRGSADAKGPLAAFLAAIEALVESGIRLRGDLLMTAVVDEETSSRGARKLVPSI